MNNVLLSRPYDGLVLLVKKSLDMTVTLLFCIAVSLMFPCCVYLHYCYQGQIKPGRGLVVWLQPRRLVS